MPFDAQPSAEVTARDRVIMLRDFLAELPDERFGMRDVFADADGNALDAREAGPRDLTSGCGTVACIAGWCGALFAPDDLNFDSDDAGELLGLHRYEEQRALFMPEGYFGGRDFRGPLTRARAVRVLDHYLATGKIDWSAA